MKKINGKKLYIQKIASRKWKLCRNENYIYKNLYFNYIPNLKRYGECKNRLNQTNKEILHGEDYRIHYIKDKMKHCGHNTLWICE